MVDHLLDKIKYLVKLMQNISPYKIQLTRDNKMLTVIQSHSGEILNGRIEKFIHANRIPLSSATDKVIFLDKSPHTKDIREICDKNKIKIVEIDESKLHNSVNKIANMFFNIVTYNIKEYQYIMLLETDCSLAIDWYDTIKQDMLNKDFWIYGSENHVSSGYHKMLSYSNKAKNMNGVAVYNRTPEFINIIYNSINYCLNTRRNYDTILSEHIRKLNMNSKLYNSPFICDLSPDSQKNINYRVIKPLTRVLHQKRF